MLTNSNNVDEYNRLFFIYFENKINSRRETNHFCNSWDGICNQTTYSEKYLMERMKQKPLKITKYTLKNEIILNDI